MLLRGNAVLAALRLAWEKPGRYSRSIGVSSASPNRRVSHKWIHGSSYIGRRQITVIDEMTRDQLRVATDAIAGPYLMVPMAQLALIRSVLDRHAVRYWVDSHAISLDGKPAIAVINFGRAGNASQIQAVLDEAG
jgi:hypothetical protein